ncbi:MAG: tetratricopeptide repeat protein [Planctomycetota bacterium]
MKRHIRVLTVLGFLCAAVVLYFPVLDGDWVFDDVRLVSTNDWLWRSFDGVTDEIEDWIPLLTESDSSEDEVRVGFRPFRFISYRLDVLGAALFDISSADQPGATVSFHLHNVLLHGLASSLLFFLVLTIFPAGGWSVALALAAIFLVHPIQTEAVAWISGRRDVLFGVCYLASLLVAVGGGDRVGWGRGLCVALLGALAMAAKEMAATLPVALLAVTYMKPDYPQGLRQWLGRIPVLLPCLLVVFFLSWRVLSYQDPGAGTDYWGGSPITAFWSMGRAILSYLAACLWPVGLSVDHSYGAFLPSLGPLIPWTTLPCWLVIITGLTFSWRSFRRGDRYISLMGPLFIVLLAPVLQIFPHPERFAERFLYIPLAALLIGFAALLIRLEKKGDGFKTPLIVILILLLSLMTRSRLSDWENPYSLWNSAVAAEPDCARAWFGLAEAARSRGWYSEAVTDLGKTISILTDVQRDRLQQGYYLQALQIRSGLLATIPGQGNLELAEQHLLTLLDEKDTNGSEVSAQETPWRELLKIRERLGNVEGARFAALTLDQLPKVQDATRLEALLYLAATASDQERTDAMTAARDLAVQVGGRAAARVAYQAGMMALEEERYQDALSLFDEALAGLDEEGRRSSARYRRAECLLKLGQAKKARQALEELLVEDPAHLPSHLSLGEILLGTKELEKAIEHFRQVLLAVPDNPQALQGVQQALVRQRIEEGGSNEPRLDPTRITALTMLADKMLGQGEIEKAREALVEAKKHAEGPAEKTRRAELILRIARLDAQQGKWDLALEGYRRLLIVVKSEDRGPFVLEVAEVVRRVEGANAALEMLKQQQQEGVEEPRLYRQMGAIAHQARQFEEAALWYRKHLEQTVDLEDSDEELRKRIEAALKDVEAKILEIQNSENNTPTEKLPKDLR